MEQFVAVLFNGTFILLMLVIFTLYHKAKQNGWIMWGTAMAALFTILSFSIGELYLDYPTLLGSIVEPNNVLMSFTGFGPVAIMSVIALGIFAVLKRKGGTPTPRANTSLILIAVIAVISGSYWNHTYASTPATEIAVTLQEYLVTALHYAGDTISSIDFS